MVFTLHRYIFRELLRVFIMATLALTVMMGLGSILPSVQEYGIGPGQVIHLVGYFLPIILTFVLPIAALFAGSLVYGRFAGDNELDACKASGISILTLIYPGLILAILVAIANLILSFHVMPAFVQRAEKSFKANAKQIVFRNIQRKGYYKASDGKYLIYADQVNPQDDSLLGVVVVEVESGGIGKIITAESAKVYFNTHKRFNEVQINAHKIYQMDPDGDIVEFEWLPITKEFPPLMEDSIQFKKIDEIKKIRYVDPTLFSPIAKLAHHAYAQFVAEMLAQDISEKISVAGKSFYKLHNGRKIVEFTAEKCTWQEGKKVELSENVIAIESDIDTKKVLRTWYAARVLLHIEGDELSPTLKMEIFNPTWREPNGEEQFGGRQFIRGLIIDKFATNNVLEDLGAASVAAALKDGPSSTLQLLQSNLLKKIQKTFRQIKAENHSRLVFGIGCVPMIMIGIGLGILKKEGHLLGAFGASSIPAAVLIVFIMMGKNVAKNKGAQTLSGLTLMWIGLALLFLLTVEIYRRLRKN